jgi:hypothetical protein
MHCSARISYYRRIPVAVEWIDCGHELASLCMLPLPEPSIFGYSDDRFQRYFKLNCAEAQVTGLELR